MSLLDLAIAKALGGGSGSGGSGGGGVSSWNDLTDKPFGDETPEPIVFDGNPEGYEIVELYGCQLAKLSDRYFTKDELVGGNLNLTYEGQSLEFPLIEDECHMGSDVGSTDESTMAFYTYPEGNLTPMALALSVHSAETITLPSLGGSITVTVTEGLYVLVGSGVYFSTTLTFPSSLKQLDEKYIPDSIARVDDIPAGGSGGVSSWNDLADKPFGEVKLAPITWDGNVDGKTYIEEPMPANKVSDEFIEPSKVIGATITLNNGNSHVVTESDIWIPTSGSGEYTVETSLGNLFFSAPGDEWIERGTYLLRYPNGSVYVTEVKFASQTLHLDEKYIPDTIARVEDVQAMFDRLINATEVPM